MGVQPHASRCVYLNAFNGKGYWGEGMGRDPRLVSSFSSSILGMLWRSLPLPSARCGSVGPHGGARAPGCGAGLRHAGGPGCGCAGHLQHRAQAERRQQRSAGGRGSRAGTSGFGVGDSSEPGFGQCVPTGESFGAGMDEPGRRSKVRVIA